ncbi:MAG: pentapeptide repeat-containing protein [Lachnospiraceae bacterium]|nr:pentapeptide repeat-containing protein [Lachnospiraceae bacterium]
MKDPNPPGSGKVLLHLCQNNEIKFTETDFTEINFTEINFTEINFTEINFGGFYYSLKRRRCKILFLHLFQTFYMPYKIKYEAKEG